MCKEKLNAVIFDIDGTLAIIEGRSPFDATLCEQDALNEPIANIVKDEFAKGTQIFLFTGRMDSCKTQTLNWLKKMDIPYEVPEDMSQEDLFELLGQITSAAGRGNGTSGTGSSQSGSANSSLNSENKA